MGCSQYIYIFVHRQGNKSRKPLLLESVVRRVSMICIGQFKLNFGRIRPRAWGKCGGGSIAEHLGETKSTAPLPKRGIPSPKNEILISHDTDENTLIARISYPGIRFLLFGIQSSTITASIQLAQTWFLSFRAPSFTYPCRPRWYDTAILVNGMDRSCFWTCISLKIRHCSQYFSAYTSAVSRSWWSYEMPSWYGAM
jgi:hypothetical protein